MDKKSFEHWSSMQTRNAPSAGTERIDRIGKYQSGLWEAIVFSSKTTSNSCNHSSWYSQFLTLLCSAQVAVSWSRTLRSYTWYHGQRTVRYCTDFASWFAKFTRLPSWWSQSDMTNIQTNRTTTRNAPSAGTERIDRIEKCHSGLCNSIVFSSKTTSCIHSSWYPHTTL